MSISTSNVPRRHFRRRPVKLRIDEPFLDGNWRRRMTASLARKVRSLAEPRRVEAEVAPALPGDPRTCWTPATVDGGIWPQPSRSFA